MTGAAKGTVLKLLIDLGTACSIEQDHLMRDLTCERIQCDEIWSFVGAKEKHVRPEKRDEYGDIWTWVAIDADTKLVPSYLVGSRDLGSAVEFMNDLATRLRYRVQLTTDGHRPYLTAVPSAFGDDVDYAQLVKLYGPDPTAPDHRYSPPVCTSVSARKISGDPDPAFVSTSYVERSNLTMRMSLRRFTRLTKRTQQEDRQPRCGGLAALRVLQPVPRPRQPEQDDAGRCRGRHRSRLGPRRADRAS